MLRQMGALVVEQAVAVMAYQPIDERLIGGRNAQRGLEVLARQRKPLQAIVGGANDDEQGRIRSLKNLLETTGIADAAPIIIDVRHEDRSQFTIRPPFSRQAGPTGVIEKTGKQPPQSIGI